MIQVESTGKSDVTVVRVAGRLDAATSPEFEQACGGAVEAGARHLILDAGGLRYVSSAGLRVVLAAGKAVQAREGTLCIAGLGGMAREIFEISGFSGLFPQYESVDAAMARF